MQDQKEAGHRHTANAGDHWSYTLATLIDAPAKKTLSEDVTQTELLARPLSPVPMSEESVEESSTNNQLGESYVTDVQYNGKHIPFHCTDSEAHEPLTNHFNKHLKQLSI